MTQFNQRVLVIAFIIFGMWIIGFFGLRTVQAFREVRSHRPPPPFEKEQPETDVQLIEEWMTIPFIAKMYHVPAPVLFDSLDIPIENNREKNLKQLNDEYYPSMEGYVEAKVRVAVLENLPPDSPPATIPDLPVTPAP